MQTAEGSNWGPFFPDDPIWTADNHRFINDYNHSVENKVTTLAAIEEMWYILC